MRMMRSPLILLVLVAGLSPSARPAQAATHALLAGVTRYDHLPPEKQLRAPANDVARIRAALGRWGVADDAMTVLADDLAGAKARPTLANIAGELDRLGRPGAVAPGDWVVIYLSGHGATATDRTGMQMSGLNSLFLPADVVLDPGGGPHRNGLMDVAIGQAITRIRERGAHVWFINDSCHSGDSVRAEARDDVREKSVMPAAMRGKASPRARPLAGAGPKAVAAEGKLVAFYAAQVTEAAREFRDGDVWVSAFTLALTHAMVSADSRDARTLASRTVLGVRSLRPRGIFQTPYADSDMPEGVALLGGERVPEAGPSAQPPVEGTGETLLAGTLEGFDTGAEFAIFDTATATAPVGSGRVVQGGLSRSSIALVSGSLPATGWFARLTSGARETRLTIAVDPSAAQPMANVLRAILADATAPEIGLRSAPPETADILLGADADGLRLVPRKALLGVVEAVPLLRTANEAALRRAAITALLRLDFLRRMERAEALAANVSAATRLQMRTGLRRFPGSAASTCTSPAPSTAAEPLPIGAALSRCDAIEAEIRNHSEKPRYIQVLAIHADGSIQTVAPRCGVRSSLKLEPGQATAGRQRASADSALPIVWFMLPKPRLPGVGRMAVQILSFPLDAATTAPDPCQFERFNGPSIVATRGELAFEEDTRSGARPSDILMQTRILEWAVP
jgi:hypothetical protein